MPAPCLLPDPVGSNPKALALRLLGELLGSYSWITAHSGTVLKGKWQKLDLVQHPTNITLIDSEQYRGEFLVISWIKDSINWTFFFFFVFCQVLSV